MIDPAKTIWRSNSGLRRDAHCSVRCLVTAMMSPRAGQPPAGDMGNVAVADPDQMSTPDLGNPLLATGRQTSPRHHAHF